MRALIAGTEANYIELDPIVTPGNSDYKECTSNYDLHVLTDTEYGLLSQALGDGVAYIIPGLKRMDTSFQEAEEIINQATTRYLDRFRRDYPEKQVEFNY